MFHSFSPLLLLLLFCGLFFFLLLLPCPSSSLPLCTDFKAPILLKKPLPFCPYNGSACCDSAKDYGLQKQFKAMKISDSSCAYATKSILCATCDPFSAHLFKITSVPRSIPLLCNSITPVKSALLKEGESNFCSSVWDSCQNVSILNSPFAPSLQGSAGLPVNSTSSKLTELWQSKSDFCSAFGDSSSNNDESMCFKGEPVSLNKTETLFSPKGMCLEKISNGSYINMAVHPDGSNRAFFSSLPGKIWLADIPKQGSGETMELDESSPFVDISDQVHFDTTFGMLGMAFHPKFAQNGRFFASFNCDNKSPGCSGRCSCNSDVNCDPSKIGAAAGTPPCQYHTVIAEYSANGTASDPSMAKSATPTEVRRIFTMGLPFTSNHAGQILFGPEDGYMYLMMGDGGGRGDPYKFAQNKKSLLGKIMRFDVDTIPSAEEIKDLDLWGNYSIPKDNPHYEDKELKPEIWALGLRNPWRCSFDSERPPYFLCGDVGQDQYEEINIITKGGNYGWNQYEGPILFDKSYKSNSSGGSSNLISPILGYTHSDVNTETGSAAISGGYVYRSMTDPCMYGSYLYADLYASDIWAAAENPKSSGKFNSSKIPFTCAHDSPVQCSLLPQSNVPSLGYIFSFGEDNQHDVYILSSTGVYRIVAPSRCNYTCSKENVTATASPGPSESPPSPSFACKNSVTKQLGLWICCLCFFLFIVGFIL